MRVAVYARFSSDNQRQESIDAQIRAIKAYCDKNGHEIVRIYQDEAVSATSDQREHFLQMIDEAKYGVFDCVIVHKLDRFARNRYDSAFYKRQLRQCSVRIISVLEQLDDSPESVILESVLEGMAEYYSMNLAREVRKGMNENALHALHNGGVPPLGFDVNLDKTYSINPTEAESVRLIFELYAGGYGYGTIANFLNDKGHKTKHGQSFGKNSIYDLLRNEKYIGRYVFNKRESKKSGNRKFKGDELITRIDNAMPRIISDDLWSKVQAKLETRRKPRMNATRFYSLTGKLICGRCGSAYVGGSYFLGRDRNKKYFTYACNSRQRKSDCKGKAIRADLLEDYVLDLIKSELLNESAIEMLAGMIMDIVKEAVSINKDLLADLNKRRDVLKGQIDKLFDLYLEGQIDKNVITEKTNKMKAEIENYESRIRALNVSAFDDLELVRIKSFMLDLRAKLGDADPAVKKVIIDSLVDEIVINEEDVTIVLKVDPLQKKKKANPGKSELTQAKVGGGEEN
jgi:site-specific DNA recombinase